MVEEGNLQSEGNLAILGYSHQYGTHVESYHAHDVTAQTHTWSKTGYISCCECHFNASICDIMMSVKKLHRTETIWRMYGTPKNIREKILRGLTGSTRRVSQGKLPLLSVVWSHACSRRVFRVKWCMIFKMLSKMRQSISVYMHMCTTSMNLYL